MALEVYHAKRNFRRTPEPRGAARRRKSGGWSFVVQKHAASHLHYDFRLELDGVLLSWAIPKGPSLDPADKRLAMHVEDHPLEYGGFEGVIPEGEYGGGTVMVWDRGTWTPQGDAAAGYAKGHLRFTLEGEKLQGGWNLVRTHGSRYGGKSGDKAWLLIKENDEFARPADGPIVDVAPDSVVSGRSIDEIARARSHVWRSKLSVKENLQAGAIPTPTTRSKKGAATTTRARKRAGTTDPEAAEADAPSAHAKSARRRSPRATASATGALPQGARKGAMPATISPVLTTLVSEAPVGEDWISEIKYDGYRMVCPIQGGRARLYSRNGKEWTHAFPAVARDLAALPVKEAWIDGEVVVLDAQGRTSFQALQNALTGAKVTGLAFFAFDLMYRDGYDLRQVPLVERKRLLREVIGDGVGTLRLGPELRGHGADFFREACKLGLEGTVCKRADSTYVDGARSRAWVKVKCLLRQEMVIGGYTDPQGSRTGFGALLLGYYEDGKLRYAGKVGTGFDDRLLRKLAPELEKREQSEPGFANPPRGYAAKGAHWVKPELVAEIAFTEWSDDGALRHPSFQGLRPDKKATEVVREEPLRQDAGHSAPGSTKTARSAPARAASAKPAAHAVPTRHKAGKPQRGAVETSAPRHAPAAKRKAASTRGDNSAEVAGVALSNPDKPYFPEAGLTKRDLAAYYAVVAEWIVPHIAERPLALVRCPDGWPKQCFFQKHADPSVHPAVPRVQVPEGKGTATYLSANSAQALVGLVQWGVFELHPWGSRAPRLDRPDRLIFDFDPDEGLGWNELVTAVSLLRTLLDEIELTGFLKTTGGKGLHVVVPIRATLAWVEAKAFCKGVADFLVRTFPDRFTATLAKERRKGKIFIDYLRNAEGATAIAPYAVRSRANAPVATPIEWSELERDVRFDHFNITNVPERLRKQKADPWKAFAETRQTITEAMRKRVA